jgi:5-methylcytosine-specific restriction protein A
MFVIGNLYERPELLNFIGSKQRQSGIIWNKEGSDTIIITTGGRHTKRVSYSDSQQEDGNWIYTGQGETGDQNPYSFANSLLSNLEDNKKIMLFSTREPNAAEVRARGHHKKLYQFEGIFKVVDWKIETQIEGKRKGDKLIKYILQPIAETGEEVNLPLQDPLENILLDPREFYYLRQKINSKSEKPKKSKIIVLTEFRDRSIAVKEYALLRAKGKCENCGHDAPFVNSNNIPFLEVHHIFSLSDEGPDTAINVAAICPNCHKEAHYGKNKEVLKDKLSKKIAKKKDNIEKAII